MHSRLSDRKILTSFNMEKPPVTLHRLYKQLVEMLNLPNHALPSLDTGELAGDMFKGFDDLPFEMRYRTLRRTLRGPYVEPQVRLWMFRNRISPLEICSMMHRRGVDMEIIDIAQIS